MISVVVCLFLTIGCIDYHSHDEDDNLLLEDEELVDNRPFMEKVRSVKLGMTFEEVRHILGSPRGMKFLPPNNVYLDWWYDLGEEVEDVKKRYVIIRFPRTDPPIVIDKLYGTDTGKPWRGVLKEFSKDLF